MTPVPPDVQPPTGRTNVANLVVSVRVHNALLSKCKYNDNNVTG